MMLEDGRRPILETPRLRLTPLEADDARRLFPIMNDPEVMAHWDIGEIDDPELVAEIVSSHGFDENWGGSQASNATY